MSLPEVRRSWGSAAPLRAACFGLVLACVPLIAACDGGAGFRPLYGSASFTANADDKLARVDVAPVPGRAGQRIRNELIFATTGGGYQAPPIYRLEIAVKESITSTLVQRDGNTLGQIYNVDANFRLIRIDTKQVVLQGTSFGRAGFERFTSIFSNVRASSDAEDRAARTVATDLKSRLAAFLATQA
jgi:LPS-assembly lipoprotein